MKRWEISNKAKDITAEDLLTILLENRGITSQEDKEAFLHPRLEDVTTENVGIDKKHLTKTLKRIATAIEKKEQIIIYGDYDVDGITGTAILWETLHSMKANVMPYIPHRIDEGYGLSIKGIENLQQKYPETALIITVDNGIVASKAVTFANEKKIDVIITDHHAVGKTLPEAYAIVHTTKLCGAGVAWLLTKELRVENGELKIEDDVYLELATLGTIADLVPLTGANRTIVKHGLEKLCTTKRAGLLHLFQQAACDNKVLGVYEVGFIIAPRLNASGRLESAMDSLRLLCTTDENRAFTLAASLERVNKERQTIMKEAAEDAIVTINERSEVKKILITGDPSYPPGVIGLVAGKLVEAFYRPSIVLSIGEKYSKASVRSISGFNIIEFLRQKSELFTEIGGHPMAAGFTIETEKFELLKTTLEEMAETAVEDALLTRVVKIDCVLPLEVVSLELYETLQQLGPFGMANPEPTFVSTGVIVNDMKLLGEEGKHLKLALQSSENSVRVEAIGFGMGELSADIKRGDSIDIVYTIDENVWNGRRTLQLKLKDIKKTN